MDRYVERINRTPSKKRAHSESDTEVRRDDPLDDNAVNELVNAAADAIIEQESRAVSTGRVAPAPIARCTYTLRATFPYASLISRSLFRVASFGEALTLDFDPEKGLVARQLHSSGVAAADIVVPRSAFLVYEVPKKTTFQLFFTNIKSLFNACKVDHTLTFTLVNEYPDKMRIRLHSDTSERMITCHGADINNMEHFEFACNEADYPAVVTIDARKFDEEMRLSSQQKASFVQFLTQDDNLTILSTTDMTSATSEVCESVVQCKVDVRGPVADVKYAVEFLLLIAAFKDVGRTTTLYYGSERSPLWIKFKMEISGKKDAAVELGEVSIILSSKI